MCDSENSIYQLIQDELERAIAIHPDYPSDIFKQLAIMQEEAGEVTKAVLDYSDSKDSLEHIKEELIQTAAMCVRMILNIEKDSIFITENTMDLTTKLSIEEQNHFLQTLFGFELVNVSESTEPPHFVLYDEEGHEFYGTNENCRFDFSTLAGIFSYTAHRAKNQGYSDCQYAMRKVLGV